MKKRKYLILVLSLIEICSLFLMYKSFNNKNTVLDDVLVKEKDKKELFAIMVEGSNGNYTESSSNTWPTNMIYNEELSGCIDIRGNKIDGALSFENNMATLNTNTTAYCYLYFDIKPVSVHEKVIEDYTNNNGVSLLSNTSSDTYPVYYYTGDITNNNLIYADKCWKMVRTTDTGGVKLIYNGVVIDGSCNNTGTATHIETSGTAFNSSYNSPAYVGYMYNKVYVVSQKYSLSSDSTSYVYGNSVTWNGLNYTLNTTTLGTWSEKYNSLSNYHYTCWSISTTCTDVYYIDYAHSNYAHYITLTGGVNISEALNEMLWADDVNTINSTIKTKIDTWYEGNIKGKKDGNGKLYSSYLENTIYCNNRASTSLGAFNPDEGSNTSRYQMYFKGGLLTCENKTDQFTLKESAGGTAGYGNNALDYPIALLTYYEAGLAENGSSTNYLNNNSNYWLLSPYNFHNYYAYGCYVHIGINSHVGTVSSTLGVRPAVSFSSMVMIKRGDGSVNSPYEVELSD